MPKKPAKSSRAARKPASKVKVGSNRRQKSGSSLGKNLLANRMAAALFVVAFAVIGVGTLLLTRAASAGGPITGVASKCLDNDKQLKTNGNKIQLWKCNSSVAQQWLVNSNGTITNTNGFCLDVKGAGTTKMTLVQLYTCNGTVAQQWKVDTIAGSAAKTIINPHSGLCLDDKYSGVADGNQIWIWTCNGTNAQKWTISTAATTPPPSTTPPPTTTPPSNPPTASADPSGEAAPVGNLPGWKQVFVDNFSDESVAEGGFTGCNNSFTCTGVPANVKAKWWDYPDGTPDTTGHGKYTPSKTLSIKSGLMNIHIHTSGSTHMTAAPIPRIKGVGGYGTGLKYGRYSVRFRADSLKGYKTAFLLWPDSNDPSKGGEIDFPEGNLNDIISAFMHPPVKDDQDAHDTTARYTSWHTATIEWRPSSVTFMLDGKTIMTSTSAKKRIPATPMTWVLQAETQTYPTTAAPASSVAGNVQIDWAAAWSYNP